MKRVVADRPHAERMVHELHEWTGPDPLRGADVARLVGFPLGRNLDRSTRAVYNLSTMIRKEEMVERLYPGWRLCVTDDEGYRLEDDVDAATLQAQVPKLRSAETILRGVVHTLEIGKSEGVREVCGRTRLAVAALEGVAESVDLAVANDTKGARIAELEAELAALRS